MNTEILTGALFAEMIRGGAANLYTNRSIVNDLNVFPIPDGDTGDNMYMTIRSGASALDGKQDSSLSAVAATVARGMLLGARGNSGVILSRIFAGIAEELADVETADLAAFGAAMSAGVRQAYGAVSVPVEGTILTVYKDAVNVANAGIDEGDTLERYFEDFMTELRASLDRTPELLDVLKEAGVVDSGGAGFIYIAQGMKDAVDGIKYEAGGELGGAPKPVDTSTFTADSELLYGYCTEFLLQLQNSKVDTAHFDMNGLISYLNQVGESVVAFLDGTIVKVHVHTMKPGEILNHCQQFGEFLTLKIENMTLQHNETTIQNRFEAPKRKKHKAFGVVAVAAGEGIKNTFASLGADVVVDGGQSMNPSAADFVRAFDETDADTIFVFPNNGNVILTAKQAAELYEKSQICVIPTHTIGEGYAGLSMFDTSSGDVEIIREELQDAISGVVTGMVSRAIRDTEKDGVQVRAGDFIGFAGDAIYVDDESRGGALLGLAAALGAKKYDVLLLICGEEADAAEAKSLFQTLEDTYRRTEVIMIDGGQPVFDYIMILE